MLVENSTTNHTNQREQKIGRRRTHAEIAEFAEGTA